MNAAELEREALKLPVAERARLAETLLESPGYRALDLRGEEPWPNKTR